MANETEQLIDLVRECVYLYDTSHPDYKDAIKITEKWTDIAHKLNPSRFFFVGRTIRHFVT